MICAVQPGRFTTDLLPVTLPCAARELQKQAAAHLYQYGFCELVCSPNTM